MRKITIRIAIVYPATAAAPKMLTIRTSPIQLACAIANCSNSGERHSKQSPHHFADPSEYAAPGSESAPSRAATGRTGKHPDAAAGERRQRRASHAQAVETVPARKSGRGQGSG